jgi:protein-disulfide isomerase
MLRTSFFIALAAVTLVACGVDTTGLSPDSSRTSLGSSSASVTVTEYADLQCPACKSAHALITKPFLEKYGNRIRFDFMHFPLQRAHVHALEAAMASECAADQGKFWEFLDLNYTNQEKLSSAALREWAAVLKLDTTLFDRCVSSGIKKKTVLSDYADGEKLGVNSTPTFFVNGSKVSLQNSTDLDTAVQAALDQTAAAPL